MRVTTVDASLDVLLKGQLRFLSSDFEVVGVASNTGRLKGVGEREGVRVVDVPMRREISPLRDLVSLVRMWWLFMRKRPYIVHSNTPKGSLLAMIAGWFAGVPHRIYTVTGLRFETTGGRLRKVLIAMERLTCRFANHVIPEGDGVRKTLLAEKITRKPLQKILNGSIGGVDTSVFDPNLFEKQPTELFNFCFVGRLVGDKGVNELVTAFVRLNEKYPHTRLTLVGGMEGKHDPLDTETYETIEKCKAIDAVGQQMNVRPFLANSDAFVFPSYREGFPNVVLQAGAMGLPQIVTNINGSNEIIENGVNGLIIPPKDIEALYLAMAKMVESPEMVESMAKCARGKIQNRYEQRAVLEALLNEYKKIEGGNV